jgi:aryl sulfotransferase
MATHPSRVLAPAERAYRGRVTSPDRWSSWEPRDGDVLVCTPPKCGTTWTQTMIAMLLAGTTELPDRVSVLSPWVDCNLGDAEAVRAAISAQGARRVLKTHTPADGFPVWEGVRVVAVYRHPLDVFLSTRGHAANRTGNADQRMLRSVDQAVIDFIEAPLNTDEWDDDTLATIVAHYTRTALNDRIPGLTRLHYADMIADHAGAVRRLGRAIGVTADEALVAGIVAATRIDTMRASATKFAPEAGKGFWKDDRAFFGSGGTEKWIGKIPQDSVKQYRSRLADLLPDPVSRSWLEGGDGAAGGH